MAGGPLIAALGLIALLVASGGGKKATAALPPTKPLDPGIPPDVDAKFKQALATSTDPDMLDQLGAAAETSGFPNTAAAFRARAAQLRGHISIPDVPVPSAAPPAAPPAIPGFPPGFAIPGFAIPGVTPSAAPPAPPPPPQPPAPVPIENLDPNIPPALAASVATLLAKADWTDQELQTADALANTLETIGFPIAAAKLRAKAIAIRAMHAGSGLLNQITNLLTTPAAQLPPFPTTPLPGTPPMVAVPPATRPGGAPPSAPLAKTYKVVAGDSPAKIAEKFTGNQQNFRQLAAANPDKSARILGGLIYAGEILTLPDAWPALPLGPAAPAAPAVPVPGVPPTGPRMPVTGYVVASGDAPYKIAQRFGVTLQQLAAANPGKSANILAGKINVGDHLALPLQAVDQGAIAQAHGTPLSGAVPAAPVAVPAAAPAAPPPISPIPGVVIPPGIIPSIPGVIPAIFTPPAAPPAPAAALLPTTYIIASGDAPYKIAQRFGVTLAQLASANPSKSANILAGKINVGDRLTLPPGARDQGPISQAKGTILAAAAGASTAGYVVQPNDTPFSIATAFTGDGARMLELAEANPALATQIRNGILFQGQQLNLPTTWHAGSPGAASSSAAAFAGVLEIIGAANAAANAQRHHWGG